MAQADIKRAFGPNLTTTPGETMSLSAIFDRGRARLSFAMNST